MTPEEHTLDNMVLHCMTAIKSDPTYKRFSNGLHIDYMNDPLSNPEITMELNIRKALKPFAEQYATQREAGEVYPIEFINWLGRSGYVHWKDGKWMSGGSSITIEAQTIQELYGIWLTEHQNPTPNPAERK